MLFHFRLDAHGLLVFSHFYLNSLMSDPDGATTRQFQGPSTFQKYNLVVDNDSWFS